MTGQDTVGAPATYPVIYQPSHEIIGAATTRAGAIQVVARRCSKLSCERWSATLADRLEGGKAWFASAVLAQ